MLWWATDICVWNSPVVSFAVSFESTAAWARCSAFFAVSTARIPGVLDEASGTVSS